MLSTTVDDIYELSPLQQGMLLHTVHDGASDMYVGQHVYTVEGALDTEALVQAWRRASEAHAALRTSFHWEGLTKPLQVVHRHAVPPVHHQDWTGLDDREQHLRLDRLTAEDRQAGFDLATPPLQRLQLIRLAHDSHSLVWTHHHLLLDGWSVPIFMNEVMTHYQALTAGGPPPAPAPPYRDYIAWLQNQDMHEASEFWRETLDGVVPGHLGALRPVDPIRGTGEVERHVVAMGGSLEAGLRDLAARHRVTLNAVLQAAWATVLRRYTGHSEVVFGCVSSGRPAELSDVDRMVGLFVNTVPVRIAVPEQGEVGPWLTGIQDRYAAVRRYEFSPLSDIKKWAGVPGQQLFESLFVLDNYSFAVEAGSAAAHLKVRSQTVYDKVSVPLALIVTPAPVSELHLLLHRDRFEPGFADDLESCLVATLQAFLHAGDAREVVAAAGTVAEPVPPGRAPGPPGNSGHPPEPPASAEEEAIAAVYREVLEREEVDVTTSFFELGGDSFSAIRAIGRIDGATVSLLAAHPSVRELAAALAALAPADDGLDVEIAALERQLAETARREQRAALRENARPEKEAAAGEKTTP